MTEQDASPDALERPAIIAVAPNGARKTRADHPALPVTAAEIARTAAACAEAGAAMIHLHVRDREGGHLLDAEAYKEATAAIRHEAGAEIIVQITTEAVGRYTPEQQMAVVRETAPEAASLALRELVAEPAQEAAAADFFAELQAGGCFAQYILYAPEDLQRFGELRRRGVIPDGPACLLFVLGRYTRNQTSQPADLLPFLAAGGSGPAWMVCAFGGREAACGVTAAALGGHVRVGFENNLLLPDGRPAPDNAALVAATAQGIQAIGRALAGPAEARKLLAEATL